MKKLRRLLRNKIISTIIGIFTFMLILLFLPIQGQANMYYFKVLNEIVCYESDIQVTGVYVEDGIIYVLMRNGSVDQILFSDGSIDAVEFLGSSPTQ